MEQNEYVHVRQALTILQDVMAREAKRHQMDQHLTPSIYCLLEEEIIPMLVNYLDADFDPDEVNEPPLTLDEMHTNAWKEHQEAHR